MHLIKKNKKQKPETPLQTNEHIVSSDRHRRYAAVVHKRAHAF